MNKIKSGIQLFWNMTRRSLQLIAFWVCIVTPLFLYSRDRKNTDLVDTTLFWLVVIYPIFYFVFGTIRQYYDDKQLPIKK